VCSTAEKLREKIPGVEKDLEKSRNELANLVTQENKAANEVVVCLLLLVFPSVTLITLMLMSGFVYRPTVLCVRHLLHYIVE